MDQYFKAHCNRSIKRRNVGCGKKNKSHIQHKGVSTVQYSPHIALGDNIEFRILEWSFVCRVKCDPCVLSEFTFVKYKYDKILLVRKEKLCKPAACSRNRLQIDKRCHDGLICAIWRTTGCCSARPHWLSLHYIIFNREHFIFRCNSICINGSISQSVSMWVTRFENVKRESKNVLFSFLWVIESLDLPAWHERVCSSQCVLIKSWNCIKFRILANIWISSNSRILSNLRNLSNYEILSNLGILSNHWILSKHWITGS